MLNSNQSILFITSNQIKGQTNTSQTGQPYYQVMNPYDEGSSTWTQIYMYVVLLSSVLQCHFLRPQFWTISRSAGMTVWFIPDARPQLEHIHTIDVGKHWQDFWNLAACTVSLTFAVEAIDITLTILLASYTTREHHFMMQNSTVATAWN